MHLRQELTTCVIRQQEIDIGIAAVVIDQAAFRLQAVPQRRLRQRLQQIDGQQRNPGFVDEGEQRSPVSGLSVSSPMMMPETTSMP